MKRIRPAFTLVEVVVSCAIVAIVLLAVQTVIVLLVKVTPDGKTGPSARIVAAKAIDLMSDDLRWATAITKDTPNEIICTVPDRNGDGNPETIRYVWNGLAGDPLYRQINGGGSVSISDNVQSFTLTYETGTVSISGGYTTSAETSLASFTNGGLLANQSDNNVDPNHRVGEYFIPALPGNATSWSVTRVLVYMEANATPNIAQTGLYSGVSGFPSTQIKTFTTPAMPLSYTWITLPLTASNLDPHVGLCFQIQGVTGQSATVASGSGGLLSTSGSYYMLSTGDGGNSWTGTIGTSLLFYAYGTYVTPNAPLSQVVLTSVRCTLQAGNDPATQAVTSIAVPNRPVLP